MDSSDMHSYEVASVICEVMAFIFVTPEIIRKENAEKIGKSLSDFVSSREDEWKKHLSDVTMREKDATSISNGYILWFFLVGIFSVPVGYILSTWFPLVLVGITLFALFIFLSVMVIKSVYTEAKLTGGRAYWSFAVFFIDCLKEIVTSGPLHTLFVWSGIMLFFFSKYLLLCVVLNK